MEIYCPKYEQIDTIVEEISRNSNYLYLKRAREMKFYVENLR